MLRKLLKSTTPRFLRFARAKDVVSSSGESHAVSEKSESESQPPAESGQKHKIPALDLFSYLMEGGDLNEAVANNRKNYPFHIPHWNPKSPDYIPSELDEGDMKVQVEEHNRIIEDFERDLKVQQHVKYLWDKEMNAELEGERGNTKNVYPQVKNYDKGDVNVTETDLIEFTLAAFTNEKTINRAFYNPKIPKLSNETEWEQELEDRPVNPHFHHSKGRKFDVETPYEKKAPHVADRLGHPEIFPYPIETLLRVERVLSHPGHQDQPFIQIPSAEPHPTLDFTPGEVIYSKPNNKEWAKFTIFANTALTPVLAYIFPYYYMFKNTTPFSSLVEENALPFSTLDFESMDYYMMWPLLYFTTTGGFLYITNMYLSRIWAYYPSKIQFNKNKDLLFVENVDFQGFSKETVMEVDHMAIVPPHVVSATRFISTGKEGLTTWLNLNTRDGFTLENNPKYWNKTGRKELMSMTMGLWDKSYYEDVNL